MSDEEFLKSIQPLLARFGQFLASQPELRTEIGQVARAISAWAESLAPVTVEPVVTPLPKIEEAPRPATVAIPTDFQIPIRMKMEEAPLPPVDVTPYETDVPESSTSEISARCRLKAELCRELVQLDAEGRTLTSESRFEWIRRSNEMKNCRLWMFDVKPLPSLLWQNLAGAYDAAAAAADLLAAWEREEDPSEERTSDVLHLAAEAQAVLYAANDQTGIGRSEYDQIALFKIIRVEGVRFRVYISKYLKSSDRADPASGPNLYRRIQDISRRQVKSPVGDREVAKVLKNIRHKLKPLETQRNGRTVDWPGVVRLLDQLLVDLRVPPSHIELRELLIPAAPVVPDDLLSVAAARAFDEVDRFLENQAPPEKFTATGPSYSADVQTVRKLLSGRDMVFIGGLVKPDRKDALELAFDLGELDWISKPEHTSTFVFEAPIARANVAVVILATRWSSHDYQNVREFCVKYGKHFVKLPAGYHPNQVASAIMNQIGQKLMAEA
jgi:hypothetical protein